MRPQEVFARFESRTNLERTAPNLRLYRLERMVELMRRLGDPHLESRVVHIAGSKGKGSTAAYVTSLLAAGGYRVGLYTSPHVTSYYERFRVIEPGGMVEPADVGGPVEPGRTEGATPGVSPNRNAGAAADRISTYESELGRQGARVWNVVEALIAEGREEDELPTTFELLTALAFAVFPALECDWLVLETGLGGRLDATNVCRPRLTLLTRIELEHTEYLGDTLEAIAGEKAGIMKRGVPALVAPQHPGPMSVFEGTAAERDCPLERVEPLPAVGCPENEFPEARRAESADDNASPAPSELVHGGPPGTSAAPRCVALPAWCAGRRAALAMLGGVQRTNAALALAAIDHLAGAGAIKRPAPDAVARAVSRTRLAARGELIAELILDGAHTAESAANAREMIGELLGEGVRIPVVIGIVSGKNVEGIAGELAPIAAAFIVSRPGTFKPGDPSDVAARISALGYRTELIDDPTAALARAREIARSAGGRVLVTGSFYMVAEVRRAVVI